MIVDGRGPTNIRSNPGGEWIGSMPEGAIFDVIADGYCLLADSGNPIRWFGVSYNGITGWSPEASGSTYFLEPYGGGSGGSSGSNSGGNSVAEVSYYYSPFGETYTFRVDTSDRNNCVILNGSTIVAQEINRAHTWFSNVYATQRWGDADNALALYLRNGGDVDTFRVMVDAFLVRELRCLHSYYQLGNVTMDLYGLGNIAFGYYSVVINRWAAHRIADAYQFREEFRLDYPDDSSQIDLGRNIANSGASVTAQLIESLIPTGFRSSR